MVQKLIRMLDKHVEGRRTLKNPSKFTVKGED